MKQADKDVARFWKYVQKSGACWVWLGGLSATGYGKFRVGSRTVSAHRFAWELLEGPIPDGLQIDHRCRNRRCVRPQHCQVVDHRTNVLVGYGPCAINARKTHCPKGHDYVYRWNGRFGWQRVCLRCRNERAKARYRRLQNIPAQNSGRRRIPWKFLTN